MKSVCVRMTNNIKERLKKQATKRGMTLNGLIMMIFDEWLKDKE